MNQQILEILNGRKGGLLTRHPKSGAIANAMGVYAPVVDTSAVSAKFTISTPTEDRAADVVEPSGFQLANYKSNPLVLYDHGFGGITLPIGKSLTPDGKLTVKVKSGSVEGECFFAQSSWEAMQIFQLVDEGVLNCASVHIDPLEATIRTGSDGRRGLHITKCDLLEWSIVGIPCNPEATRKVLDRGKLAGRKIAKPLEKVLKAFAAQPKGLVQGMSLEVKAFDEQGNEIPVVTKAAPPPKKPEDDEEKPEGKPEEASGDEEPTEDTPEAEQDGDDGETPEAPAETEGQPQAQGEPQDHSQKPGAQLASGIHTAVTQFTEQVSAELGKQENPEIQAMANDVIDGLNAIAERCADGYSAAYGGAMPQAGGMQQQQPAADPQEQQAFKHFTMAIVKDAGTKTPKKTEYGMRAIAKGLSDLSMKRSLSPEDIHRLGHWAKRLFEFVDAAKTEAKSLEQQPKETENDEFLRAAAELLAQSRGVGEKLQSLRQAKC